MRLVCNHWPLGGAKILIISNESFEHLVTSIPNEIRGVLYAVADPVQYKVGFSNIVAINCI